MENKYDRLLAFSIYKGFENTAEAIHVLGINEFRKQSANFIPEKLKTSTKPNIVFKKKKNEVTPQILSTSKVISFDNRYKIYNDGRVFSFVYNRFLKGRKHDGHLVYELGRGNKYTAARLVYFHFCKHDKNSIHDLEQISTIDKNPENLFWQNLEEISKKEILKKHNIRGKTRGRKTIEKMAKIKDTELDFIKKLLEIKTPKNRIAKIYNCSSMSVLRFTKRHKI